MKKYVEPKMESISFLYQMLLRHRSRFMKREMNLNITQITATRKHSLMI